MDTQKQIIVSALPTTGEIRYGELVKKLQQAGNDGALSQFHAMRRAGELKTRLENVNGELVLFVAKPA